MFFLIIAIYLAVHFFRKRCIFAYSSISVPCTGTENYRWDSKFILYEKLEIRKGFSLTDFESDLQTVEIKDCCK